ncbi:ABC transporter permease [Shinella daejeonensis]|uniref:ABC transporter permease n=1 Tax=Shinella daejeonensis TaxID=659017 RepID=UPI0020C751D4|nr:ABC transporter permease [Shinella daejeonensis]MCP8894808.1 ABC transporter permease [Shinella daejeonensis]
MSNISASAATPSFTPRLVEAVRQYGTLGIFLVLVIVASFWSDAFLTERNLMNVVRQVASGAGIMAVGMLFVVLTRGIDLSVGSIAAVGSVLCAYLVAVQGYSVPVTILLVILAGSACGMVTGFFVAYMRLPSFVISLAMMAIARGISLIISAGRPITMGSPGASLVDFGSGFFLGIPQPAILMLIIFAIGGVVLTYTSFGRLVTAIGSNEEAVRLSGVPVERYVLSVYVISGALAAIAGIVAASRTGIGTPQVGVGAELDVIAAVVIGGASLMGGRGGMFNTLLGALILGIITNIMNLAGVPGYHQNVYLGLIIILAMLIQFVTARSRR